MCWYGQTFYGIKIALVFSTTLTQVMSVTESEKTCRIYTKYTCMLYIMYLRFWVSYNNFVSFRRSSSVWRISGKNLNEYHFQGKVIILQTQNSHVDKTGFLRSSHIIMLSVILTYIIQIGGYVLYYKCFLVLSPLALTYITSYPIILWQ